jgi:hypothetical protein
MSRPRIEKRLASTASQQCGPGNAGADVEIADYWVYLEMVRLGKAGDSSRSFIKFFLKRIIPLKKKIRSLSAVAETCCLARDHQDKTYRHNRPADIGEECPVGTVKDMGGGGMTRFWQMKEDVEGERLSLFFREC